MITTPCRFIARTGEKTELYEAVPDYHCLQPLFSDERGTTDFHHDGRLVYGINQTDVVVMDTTHASEITRLELKEVLHAQFSRTGAFLSTLQRPDKNLKASHKNLQIWSIPQGECVWSGHQSNVSDDVWPLLHWTDDDSYVFVAVTNTVHAFTPQDNFSQVAKKLPVIGIAAFAISPGTDPKLAAYVPETKSIPASVTLYPISKFPKDRNDDVVSSNRKSFYRASGVELLWNSSGSALLCSSFSDVDITNKNYYGEQHLHFFDGETEKSCNVPNIPKGPIHDVQWTTAGDYFAVVAGFMPSKTLLFDEKCKPLFDLGSGAYNFVRFDPFGHFLCVAGFGNLPGDIVFYERKPSGKCTRLNSIRCPSVTLEWSPCGRYVLTAITAPRLRVDNGFKLFTYLGEEVIKEERNVLLEAKWIPTEDTIFTDRPISPTKRSAIISQQKAKQEDALTAAYVPPHLRGKERRTPPASLNLGQSGDTGGRIRTETKTSDVPGGTFVSKSAAKNAKRRAKKRTEGPKSRAETSPQESTERFTDSVISSTADAVVASQEDKQKRARNLRKKLKQISQLKATMGQQRTTLEKEQRQKIESEAALIAELQSLES